MDTLNRLEIAPPDSWHPLVFLEAVRESFPIWAERQRAAFRGRQIITLAVVKWHCSETIRMTINLDLKMLPRLSLNQDPMIVRLVEIQEQDIQKENALKILKIWN